jgi:hypothetical protein
VVSDVCKKSKMVMRKATCICAAKNQKTTTAECPQGGPIV